MQLFLQHILHLLHLFKLVLQILKFVITLSGKRDLFSLVCLFTAVKPTTQWSLYCTPAHEGNTHWKRLHCSFDDSLIPLQELSLLKFTGKTLLPRMVCDISTKQNHLKGACSPIILAMLIFQKQSM